MRNDDLKTASIEVLRDALSRLLGLTNLYQKELLAIKNQRVREALERLIGEKKRHAREVQQAILDQGGKFKDVRITPEHTVSAPRELIPWLYQEEQTLSLWYHAQMAVVQEGPVKALLQALVKEEEGHLSAIKNLYREITHC
jgi:rubrerythrin